MLNRERDQSGQQSDQPEVDSDRPVKSLINDGAPPIETARGLHLVSNDTAERHRADPDNSPYIGDIKRRKLELVSDIEGVEPETIQVNLGHTPEGLKNLEADNRRDIAWLETTRDDLAAKLAAIEAELIAKRGDYSSTSTEIEDTWETNPEQVTRLLEQGEKILNTLGQLKNSQQRLVDSLDSISQRLNRVLYPERNRYDEIDQQRQTA